MCNLIIILSHVYSKIVSRIYCHFAGIVLLKNTSTFFMETLRINMTCAARGMRISGQKTKQAFLKQAPQSKTTNVI